MAVREPVHDRREGPDGVAPTLAEIRAERRPQASSAEIMSVWLDFDVQRIPPDRDMTNECRLAAEIVWLRREAARLQDAVRQLTTTHTKCSCSCGCDKLVGTTHDMPVRCESCRDGEAGCLNWHACSDCGWEGTSFHSCEANRG